MFGILSPVRDLYLGTDGLNMFLAEDREETRGFLSFFFS